MALDEDKLKSRLEFVRLYARWVKSVPNRVWSEQQAFLVNSLIESGKNIMVSPSRYLEMKERVRRRKTSAKSLLQNNSKEKI